ncbi:MAG TPA: FHA domain-containing protein [Thermoguttaceae bacterium]|nr:FHA domain-containing protein [Thermoguttaceae bacterium]
MDAKLIVVGGRADNRAIRLKLPTVIGRSKRVDLTVAHPMISRKHCELFESDGLLMIRDLGSLNGTVVGGRKVEEAPLPPEERFTVGPVTFRADYQYDGDLDAVLAEKTVEPVAPHSTPVFFDSNALDGVTPYHPQTAEEATDESLPESSAWSDPENEPIGPWTAGFGGDVEEEEEEPEPTPPPPSSPTAEQPAAESTAAEPPADETMVKGKPSPEKSDAPTGFPSPIIPATDESAPVEDEALDDFLKGFE